MNYVYFRHYLSIAAYEMCCTIAPVLGTLTDTDWQCSKLNNFGCDLKAHLKQPLPLTPQSLISALLHLEGVVCSNNCHYSVYCNCPSHLLLFFISNNYWQLIFLHCFFFIAFTLFVTNFVLCYLSPTYVYLKYIYVY